MITLLVACAGSSGPWMGPPVRRPQPQPGENPEPLTTALWSLLVEDPTGTALPGLTVDIHRGASSMRSSTDADGRLTAELEPGPLAAEVSDANGAWMTATFVFEVEAGDEVEHAIVLPQAPSGTSLPNPADFVDIGDGLLVNVGADDVSPPPFEPPTSTLAAVRADLPFNQEPIVASWLLAPYRYTATMPARFDIDHGLPDGTVVEVWQPDLAVVAWQRVGELEVVGSQLEGPVQLEATVPVILVER
ncbi:MAG: hypothetical protein AAGA48_13075 [Myxococcota bacterium]